MPFWRQDKFSSIEGHQWIQVLIVETRWQKQSVLVELSNQSLLKQAL